jgi:surfeit locus 1 family protein
MKSFFSVRWISTTLLAVLAVFVLIGLGFWQLDRLTQKRTFIARVESQISAVPESILHFVGAPDALPEMEYRPVTASGKYDYANEILIRNQVVDEAPGFRMVDRGWISLKDGQAYLPGKFNEGETVSLKGVLRQTQLEPAVGGVPDPTLGPGQTRLSAWNFIDISRIQQQVSYHLLPVYIQQAPDPDWNGQPVRDVEAPVLDEGPHLGYAIQWFAFAAVLTIGYPFFVRRSLKEGQKTR